MITPHVHNFPTSHIQLLYCHFMDTEETWVNNNNKGLAEPIWRFYWNSNDAGWLTHEGCRISLGPGTAVLIAPNTPYEKLCSGAVQHFHLHFHAGYLFDSIEAQIFQMRMQDIIRGNIGRVLQLLEEGKPSVELLTLCVFIITWALSNIPAQVLDRRPQHPRIAQIFYYIDNHLGEDLTNQQLASLINMSTNSFINLFATECGIPPHRYINQRRLAKARNLLNFSRSSIEEISAMVGFADRNYFTRVFTRQQGMGPAAYRNSKSPGTSS